MNKSKNGRCKCKQAAGRPCSSNPNAKKGKNGRGACMIPMGKPCGKGGKVSIKN